jgi:hypothetical protein
MNLTSLQILQTRVAHAKDVGRHDEIASRLFARSQRTWILKRKRKGESENYVKAATVKAQQNRRSQMQGWISSTNSTSQASMVLAVSCHVHLL